MPRPQLVIRIGFEDAEYAEAMIPDDFVTLMKEINQHFGELAATLKAHYDTDEPPGGIAA